MTTITYQDNQYQIEANESVLDGLLRHDVNIPYACKAGVCHVCVMACQQGEIDPVATNGLGELQIANGYFLSCQCIAQQPLVLTDADDSKLFIKTIIKEKEMLSERVCRLKLKPSIPLIYQPGQFINIKMNDDHIRSYSLASLPTEDGLLELHVKKMGNGLLSNWLVDDVKINDSLDIQGPFGHCFYQAENTDKDMLMIATGTGLAPILGIIRMAIASGHKGEINLYHGENTEAELYLHQYLTTFAAEHPSVNYFPCVAESSEKTGDDIQRRRAADLAFENNQQLDDSVIYLSGSPAMVDQAKNLALVKGVSEPNIFTDPFVTKDLREGGSR